MERSFSQSGGSGRPKESISEPRITDFNGTKIFQIPVGPRGTPWGYGTFTWKVIMKDYLEIEAANQKISAGTEDYNDSPLIVMVESNNGQFPSKEIDLKNLRIQAIVKYHDKIQAFLDERDREWKASRPAKQQ